MEPLSFSKKFLDKFGNTVFSELARRDKIFGYFYRLHSNDKATTDVRKWMNAQLESRQCLKLVEEQGWYVQCKHKDYDAVAHAILKWVNNHITYRPDLSIHGMPEYWQTADETMQLKVGDCEDMSVLIVVLAVLSGIPPDRIKLQWGSVIGGGHCYVVYRRQEDAVEVILDACYWYSPLIIKFRKWFGAEKNYLTIWGNAKIVEINHEAMT